MAESFNGLYKAELIFHEVRGAASKTSSGRRSPTSTGPTTAASTTSIGKIPPAEFEAIYYRQNTA
jgi:hypothetical protein